MNKIYLSIALFFFAAPKVVYGQIAGDFQTKNATGSWSNYTDWNTYNGLAWVAATSIQIPTTASSVFIQNGHTINVDITTAVCNDLNFTASGTTLKVIVQPGKILSMYGNLNQSTISNVPFPSFGAGAKIIFAGSANQTITNSSNLTNLNTVEINKSGGTFTLPGVITNFDVFTLSAGTMSGAPGSTLQGNSTLAIVNVNGGIWNQTSGGANKINGGTKGATCALHINSGVMTLSTTSGLGLGYNFSNVTISNGGILNLNSDIAAINFSNTLSIDATSSLNTAMVTTPPALTMSFLGTVNYNHSAAQSIINTSYANLGLSGGGNKTPSANLNVVKNIIIGGTAVLPLNSSIGATIGGNWTNYGTSGFTESNSTVDFNGSGAQSINTTGGCEDFFKLNKSGAGTLTLISGVSLAGTSSELNISMGILDAGINKLTGTASTAFVMSGGTLKLAKLSTTIPEFAISTYSLTGGTIEFNGAGNQTLHSGKTYANLKFSGSTNTTLSSTSTTSVIGTVFITGSATLDLESSNTFGDINTNLTMDGGVLKMGGSTGAKPDIDGTYNLTGGVIKFAGSNAGTTQPIKGKIGGGVGTSIIYKNIEVTGTNVGTSNDNIYLNDVAGSFTVKNGATFSISSPTIRASSSSNTSTVTVENNAIFKTGNNQGFSGTTESFGTNSSIHFNIAAANISLIAGSTVDYISPVGQEISNQIPYQHLTISAMGGTEKAPSATLSILGNFTKSGTSIFDHNNGTVLLNGTTQSFAGVTYNNLWLDNAGTKTLSGNAVVIDSLKIGNITTDPVTNLTLETNYLTLQSTAAKTARLATVAPNANITYNGAGRFIVQRNIPPQRAWRLITAPVVADATKTVFNAWQRGGATGSLTTAGTGLFISGPLAPAGGLDITPKGNYSLKLFNGATLTGVDNTTAITISGTGNTPGIPVNYGMFLFVRGDRSSNALFYPPYKNETTLSDTGMVQIKTQTFSLSGPAATGYSLVGNPYASEVDMSMVMASGVNVDKNKYYMYDPFINLDQGGYLTYFKNTTTGLFESAPISPGGQKNNVYSSQAFYVLRTATGATLTFTENNKSSATTSSMFRPTTTTQSFRTNLYLLNTDTTILADGNITLFDAGYLNEPYKGSILKFTNIKENLGLLRNGKIYAVENLNPITLTDTLFLNLLKTTHRNYQFEFVPQNMDPLLTAAVLDDNYTDIKTPINLEAACRHTFSITADTASAASNRFRVIFKALPVARLPVTFISIKAIRQNDDIAIQWEVINELNISEYEVEKSHDGQHFTKVNNTVAKGLATTIEYSWLDKNALQGDNFFRIKSIANNGDVVYSSIVKLEFTTRQNNGISIYTNPVTDGIIGLQLLNQPQGIYQFRLLNNLGQLILSKSINYTGASRVTLTPDKIKLVTGNYHLQVVKPDKITRYIKVFVQIK